jgi:RadC-like JAB domain
MTVVRNEMLVGFRKRGQAGLGPPAREVVKKALRHNAAAVILVHITTHLLWRGPSQGDELITRKLREALALVDIRVLDHSIVAGARPSASPFSASLAHKKA